MRKLAQHIPKESPPVPEKLASSTNNSSLQQLAFDNSIQANIISDINNGKIIIANKAACKLLGYSKRALLTKSRSDIFDIKETAFKRILKQKKTDSDPAASVNAIKKSGKLLPCEIVSAIFEDEDGLKKVITTISDMSQHILKQKKTKEKEVKIVAEDNILTQEKFNDLQLENSQWKKNVGKTLYDVMWDWDIASGQIYVGDSIEEVFGYKIPNNSVEFSDFIFCLLPKEKDTVEKKLLETLASNTRSWKDAYMFRRFDGTIASTTCRASIIRNEEGGAIRLIGAIQDITKLEDLEKKLEEQITIHDEDGEKFLLATKLSFDVIMDWNLITNELFIGDGFEELFGYPIVENKGDIVTDWSDHIHPDDKEAVEKELHNAIISSATQWEHDYRIIKSDGSLTNVFIRSSILRQEDGKAYRMIGAIQDLSRQIELEEQLEMEIKLKERLITEATEDAKDTERSEIGRELHDNINQLLSASRMFLEMAKRGGDQSKIYLARSSEYTLTAIQEIRKLTQGMTSDLELCDAIDKISQDSMETNPVKISCSVNNFIENSVNDKFKLNLFRIIQEGLNNILKHAKATEVTIDLSQTDQSIILSISDNGIGFDTEKKQKGIGLANIRNRAASYGATAIHASEVGQGCVLTVAFPLTEALRA